MSIARSGRRCGGDDGGTNAGEAYALFGGAFGGSAAPVTTTGTGAAESLIGGLGNDVLAGGGGVDSIRGGAGIDTISVGDLAFRSIDGRGDTLVLLEHRALNRAHILRL